MSDERPASSKIRVVLAALLGFVALNAVAGGYYGMAGAVGVPTEWLRGSPFSDYHVPSLILFVVVGGSCLSSAVAVATRARYGRASALAAGAIVLAWILIQVMIIGYVSWMQPVTFVAGTLVLALGWLLPSPMTTRLEQSRAWS